MGKLKICRGSFPKYIGLSLMRESSVEGYAVQVLVIDIANVEILRAAKQTNRIGCLLTVQYMERGKIGSLG